MGGQGEGQSEGSQQLKTRKNKEAKNIILKAILQTQDDLLCTLKGSASHSLRDEYRISFMRACSLSY